MPHPLPRGLLPFGAKVGPLLAAFALPAAVGASQIVVPDSASPVYYSLVVAAGEAMTVGGDAQLAGNLHSNTTVTVEAGSQVDGDVSAVEEVVNQGTITGAVTSGAPPVTLPALWSEEEALALADRVFEGDVVFADTQIDDVVFVQGNASLQGSVGGAGAIIATEDIRVETLDPGPGGPEPGFPCCFSVVAFKQISITEGATFKAVLYAGSNVVLEKNVTLEGVVVANGGIEIMAGSVVTFLQLDNVPPVIDIVSPTDGSFIGGAGPGLIARYTDADSGVDPSTVELLVDGVDRTEEAQISSFGIDLELPGELSDGPHGVLVRVSDVRGNSAEAGVTFTLDTAPPVIQIVAPSDPVVTDDPAPTIRVTFTDALSGADLSSLGVRVDGSDISAVCTVAVGDAVCTPPSLVAGEHTIQAALADRAGNLARVERSFSLVLDETAPELAIVAPAATVLGDPTPLVRVTYSDAGAGIDTASLRVHVDDSEITTGCAIGPAEATCEAPQLARGAHVAVVAISDRRGNIASATSSFAVAFPVAIAFDAPVADAVVGAPVVAVEGTVDPEAVAVEVNGVAATLGGGHFSIAAFGLHDGVNYLVAVARDAAGNVGTATRRVFADTTPPAISITAPEDGATVYTPTVAVGGLVNDLTLGTVSETEVTVTVNGQPATVVNRSFFVAGVPLALGANSVRVEAVDRAGNTASAEVDLSRLDPGSAPRLLAFSGDGQTAPIGEPLPQPLVVRAVDAAGQPRSGLQVVFRVVRGNGTFADGSRLLLTITGADGQAQASLRLGSRSGVGVDRVVATSVGTAGEVPFVAITAPGPAAMIHVVSGNNQRGAVGGDLPQPLVAVVFDGGGNPLAGVPVTFRSVAGDGVLAGGETVTVTTDESGLAAAVWRLGLVPGLDNHFVEASFPGLASQPATFKASAFVPGDPDATELLGVVLDNQGDPVPEVTLRLRGAAVTAATDAAGEFRLTQVPVGRVFLLVDPSTTSRPGEWTGLEFELFTVPGVVNTLDRPIHILPLDPAAGVAVDETHGGTVTIPGLPGFALEVAPGSVTFPGGGRSGFVSVTAVHADRIPMAPGGGMQPRLIVTIQPAGAHFDPPAPLTLPNVDGLAPGTVTELFSFDHDLGAFVAIGTGTVSEDGLVVRSDPGFGILEAGWHCGSPPSGSGAAAAVDVAIAAQPEPVPLCVDANGQPEPRDIPAEGRPPLDAEYTWEISEPAVATLDPVGSGLCRDQSQCPTTAEAGSQHGLARAKITIVCTTTGATADDEIELVNPGVEVLSVDLCDARSIQTRLEPVDPRVSGTFILRMIGANGSQSEILNEERAGGDYTDEIDFARLPARVEFTEVEAEWRVGDCAAGVKDREGAHFTSLGTVRHTQYNCPGAGDPSCAGGGNANACFTTNNCQYSGPGTVPQTWLTQVTGAVQGTGCGTVPGRGNVQIEQFCLSRQQLQLHPMPAACQGAAIFRAGGAIAGHCAGVGPGTVAVDDGYLNGLLPCGSNICIFTGAGPGVQKTVTDRCPGCGLGRIDNFSASGACGIHDFHPGAVTLRIY